MITQWPQVCCWLVGGAESLALSCCYRGEIRFELQGVGEKEWDPHSQSQSPLWPSGSSFLSEAIPAVSAFSSQGWGWHTQVTWDPAHPL